MRRTASFVLLVGLLAGCGSSTSAQHSSSPTPATSGPALVTHTDSAFSLSYPSSWTYKEGTGPYGIYNTFVGSKGPSGYEPSVLVGRTVNADAQTFADGMTLFETTHPDRKLQPATPIDVKGAVKAAIIRNTRTFKGTPLESWNVFVLTPSHVGLNVEFVGPHADFDTALMQRMLGTLVAR